MAFEIDPQLQADTHQLGRMSFSHILLHRNSSLPWFILVPETDLTEFIDLPERKQSLLMREATLVGQFLKEHWELHKTNLATLGNVVAQLHLHVIGRFADDPCWPRPVWGNLPAGHPWSAEKLRTIQVMLQTIVPEFVPADELSGS